MRKRIVPRFIVVLYAASAVLHVAFVLFVVRVLSEHPPAVRHTAAWILAAIGTYLLGGRIHLAQWDKHISTPRRYLEEAYFVHLMAAVFSFVFLLVLLPFAWMLDALFGVPWGFEVLPALYPLFIPVSLWGIVVRRRLVHVAQWPMPMPKLTAEWKGYRIGFISDLHLGTFLPKKRLDAYVDRINAMDLDLVCLGGDYVTSGNAFHDDLAASLGRLQARDGVIAIMGNHDYFGDGEPLIHKLREAGLVLLRNQQHEITRKTTLTIVGVDDTWTGRTDIKKAVADLSRSAPSLCLAHDPKLFDELASHGVDFVLSGHTHWGQVALPFYPRLNMSLLIEKRNAGWYKLGDSTMYVGPGLGTTGPPFRLGVPPEISVFTIEPGSRVVGPG